MARLIYATRALDDLERLTEFVGQVAPGTEGSVAAEILDGIEILAAHPLMGRRTGDHRELVVSRGATGYLVLYIFDAADMTVRVLRIRHQREAGYMD